MTELDRAIGRIEGTLESVSGQLSSLDTKVDNLAAVQSEQGSKIYQLMDARETRRATDIAARGQIIADRKANIPVLIRGAILVVITVLVTQFANLIKAFGQVHP